MVGSLGFDLCGVYCTNDLSGTQFHHLSQDNCTRPTVEYIRNYMRETKVITLDLYFMILDNSPFFKSILIM